MKKHSGDLPLLDEATGEPHAAARARTDTVDAELDALPMNLTTET